MILIIIQDMVIAEDVFIILIVFIMIHGLIHLGAIMILGMQALGVGILGMVAVIMDMDTITMAGEDITIMVDMEEIIHKIAII